MKILFCSSEVYPFSKIGGVADFSESLPKAISKLNNTIYVVSPYYQRVNNKFGKEMQYICSKDIHLGENIYEAKYYRTIKDGIHYFFIGHEFFDRKYFFNHNDDIYRFMFFNLAILEMLKLIDFYPNIIHVNDWTSALVPYFLTTYYNKFEEFKNIKTLLTIHNLEKQGAFSREYEHLFKSQNFTYLHLNSINFLKTGIMRANKINTVSKSYKSEILTKFFGFSLDGALKSRQLDLVGIQNGLDFNRFNPKTDKHIYYNYDKDDVIVGKLKNKEKLLKKINLKDSSKMLVSFVSRFAKEKGVGLIMDKIEKLLKDDLINFVVIGEGDIQFEMFCEDLENKYPNNFKYFGEHDFEMSQKITAASDLMLLPSLYEASGLNQMIAMRFGTIPLVRNTGGLKDTVIDINEEEKTGTGFKFENFDDDEFYEAIIRANNLFKTNKELWNKIINNAMLIDNDIEKMAKEYITLYENMIKEK